nr:glutamate dehydrogenase [Chloroflexota bacterium]
VVTGKPVEIGGSAGRLEATGRGVMVTARDAMQLLSMPVEGATAAVQGFGNVGSVAARTAHDMGMKVIAVTDVSGGVHNPNGLDIPALVSHLAATRSVAGFPGADSITNDELLTLKVDVLIPAALENQITSANAHKVQCKVLAEGANGPTTPEADNILNDRGIFIIPDILCNGGGVVVSYFEWVQDLQAFFWDEDEINKQLERHVTKAFAQVMLAAEKHKVDNRTAAQVLAIQRVADVTLLRGIYP